MGKRAKKKRMSAVFSSPPTPRATPNTATNTTTPRRKLSSTTPGASHAVPHSHQRVNQHQKENVTSKEGGVTEKLVSSSSESSSYQVAGVEQSTFPKLSLMSPKSNHSNPNLIAPMIHSPVRLQYTPVRSARSWTATPKTPGSKTPMTPILMLGDDLYSNMNGSIPPTYSYYTEEQLDLEVTKLLQIRKDYQCPITHQLLNDPVYLIEDTEQVMYERAAIEEWLLEKDAFPPGSGANCNGKTIGDKRLEASKFFIKQLQNYKEKTSTKMINMAKVLIQQQVAPDQALLLVDRAIAMNNSGIHLIEALKCKYDCLQYKNGDGTDSPQLQTLLDLIMLLDGKKIFSREVVHYVKQILLSDLKNLVDREVREYLLLCIIKHWNEVSSMSNRLEVNQILHECADWIPILLSTDTQNQFIQLVVGNRHMLSASTIVHMMVINIDFPWDVLNDLLRTLFISKQQTDRESMKLLDQIMLHCLSDKRYSSTNRSDKCLLGIEYYEWRCEVPNLLSHSYEMDKQLLQRACELDENNHRAKELLIQHTAEFENRDDIVQTVSQQMTEVIRANSELSQSISQKDKQIEELVSVNSELKRELTSRKEYIETLLRINVEDKTSYETRFSELNKTVQELQDFQRTMHEDYLKQIKSMTSYITSLQHKLSKFTKEKQLLHSSFSNSETSSKLQIFSILANTRSLKGSTKVIIRKGESDPCYPVGQRLESNTFQLCGFEWRLKIYPSGQRSALEGNCSCYLSLQQLPGDAVFQMKARIGIKLDKGKHKYKGEKFISAGGDGRGRAKFCTSTQLTRSAGKSTWEFQIKIDVIEIRQFKDVNEQQLYNQKNSIKA